jgi:hypothetical protein
MEQFFPSTGKVTNAKKRLTKRTKGHFKTIEHKFMTGHFLKPKKKKS